MDKFLLKFYQSDQPKIDKDINDIVDFMRLLKKFKAIDFNPKFQEAMTNYIRMYATEKLVFTKDQLEFTTKLVLRMCGIKEEQL